MSRSVACVAMLATLTTQAPGCFLCVPDDPSGGYESDSDDAGATTGTESTSTTSGSESGEPGPIALDNLLGLVVAAGWWVEGYLYEGHYDTPCQDCQEILMLRFATGVDGSVTIHLRYHYHEAGSSGFADGEVYCSRLYDVLALETVAGFDPYDRVAVRLQSISEECVGVGLWDEVVFQRVEDDAEGNPSLVAWWGPNDPAATFPGWTSTEQFDAAFPLIPCEPDAVLGYCVPECTLATCDYPEP